MNTDPTYQEMIDHLAAVKPAIDSIDMARAAHNFAANFHGGQDSNLYEALSNSPYRPGATEGQTEEESLRAYDELTKQFMGKSILDTTKKNHENRARRAAVALAAFCLVEGEEPSIEAVHDLLVDIQYLIKHREDDVGCADTAMVSAADIFLEEAGDLTMDEVGSGDTILPTRHLTEAVYALMEEEDWENKKGPRPEGQDPKNTSD